MKKPTCSGDKHFQTEQRQSETGREQRQSETGRETERSSDVKVRSHVSI